MNFSQFFWLVGIFLWVFLLSLQSLGQNTNTHDCRDIKPLLLAVIDTGADIDHLELKKWIWNNSGEMGKDSQGKNKATNGLDDDGDGFADNLHGWNFIQNNADVRDFHGHGSHVSGLISKHWMDESCPRIQLMILKYYDQRFPANDTLESSLKAFRFALKKGAKIINFSGGGMKRSRAEEELMKTARDLKVLVVAAAGNDGMNSDYEKFYPAGYKLPNILSVAALNQKHRLLGSSNYGKKSVQIAADGENLISSLPGNQSGAMTGTSQATALTSGVAALVALQNPWIKQPEDIIRMILLSSQKNPNLRALIGSEAQLNIDKSINSKDDRITASGQQIQNTMQSPENLFLDNLVLADLLHEI